MELSRLGFIFELGFNIGILSLLKQKKLEGKAQIEDSFLLFIEKSLTHKKYTRENIYIEYTKEIVDENLKNIIKKNIDYLLFKGILSGKNFCREFIDNKIMAHEFKVEYFQANFYNALNTSTDKNIAAERDYYRQLASEQLGFDMRDEETDNLNLKGEYFKADSILLISSKGKYYLCVVDNGISIKNIIDYSNIEKVKLCYKRAIFNRRLKSSFSNLAIDSKGKIDLNINDTLCNYILALNKRDKPLFKMIQAGSYAYSFLNILKKRGNIKEENVESICIVGYTDEEISSINISKDNISLLGTLKSTYEETLKYFSESYKITDRTNKESTLEDKKHDVFARVRGNFKKLFNMKDEFKSFANLSDGLNYREIKECCSEYQNTAGDYNYQGTNIGFRTAHAMEIDRYIRDRKYNLLFLTGNPGIGKTTTIVKYLQKEEGFIFIYISPRIQVNKDIEQKFSNGDKLYDDQAIYLTVNGNDETFIKGKKVNVVNFNSNMPENFSEINSPVMFLDNKRNRDFSLQKIIFKNKNSKEYYEADNHAKGVLSRLAEGINHIISEKLCNKIIATAAVQSLKVVDDKKTTAMHFNKIFNTIYNAKTKCVDENSFKSFSKHYKNVIFMLDEITGDESGVQFLQELMKVLFNNIYNKISEEQKEKVNFKIIVADASITDIDIIEKHLSSKENESDKIYYKLKESLIENALDISSFVFKNKYNAISINTNSYPAKKLNLDYRLFIDVKKANEDDKLFDNDIREYVNAKLAEEAVEIISARKAKQIIIYIQDIKRIKQTIGKMSIYYKNKTGKNLESNKDYIEINSSISEKQKEEVFKLKDTVKIILMTSSASRGISFPNTTVLMVDIPKFDIEKNIMEILQLIYRGRGQDEIDINEEKSVKFYIGDTIYHKGDREVKIKESFVCLMTFLMILKVSILTRINGYASLGKKNIALIPIGGKGLSTYDDMLVETISSLIRKLKKEINKEPANTNLKNIYQSLIEIFSSIKIETSNSIYKIKIGEIVKKFYDEWNHKILNLINFDPFYEAYITGDIAMFRIKGNIESSINLLREVVIDNIENKNTLKKLFAKSKSDDSLPDSIRSEMLKVAEALNYFYSNKREYSMNLIDNSSSDARFVAIPLIAPFILKNLEKYYADYEEDEPLKDILEAYLKEYYSVGNTLPITPVYGSEPFIVFKSNTLLNMRKKIFNDKYLFCSSEINFLNLLLNDK